MTALFLHGVPDTPAMWTPLIDGVRAGRQEILAPAMPGFGVPLSRGFPATKEAYLDWLMAEIAKAHGTSGPLHLVGHDWGAVLVLRAAHLAPEMVASWTVMNAVPMPGYRWHATARLWQTPVLGELFMLAARHSLLARRLGQAGMPPDLVAAELPHVGGDMKRAILRLYRSAVNLGEEWGTDLSGLSDRGLVIWGSRDPFVGVKLGRRFSERTGVPLHVEEGAGHWTPFERAAPVAERLLAHWAGTS